MAAPRLKDELALLETETFEIEDFAETGDDLAGSSCTSTTSSACSTTSTCSCSTSSCCSTTSSSCASTSSCA